MVIGLVREKVQTSGDGRYLKARAEIHGSKMRLPHRFRRRSKITV